MGSGAPFTRNALPNPADVQFGVNAANQVQGTAFGNRLPFNYRFDLRLDKDFYLNVGKKSDADGKLVKEGRPFFLNVYAVFLNVLNTQNILSVYGFSGLPDDSGFLNTDIGTALIQSQIDPTAFVDQYEAKQQNPNNFSLPRRIRVGVTFSF
jgi:hypothetical protein